MARHIMEVNNITMDTRDNPYENFLLVQQGDDLPDRTLPASMENIHRLECNKKITYTCLASLAIDQRQL